MACRLLILIMTAIAVSNVTVAAANSAARLRCGPFTEAQLPRPEPQVDPEAVERFQAINRETQARSHGTVFLGDSLTQKWSPAEWNRDFAHLDALNAGVNGDRTENLLWRMDHGNLDGQHPEIIVLLIGTNDIGRNRPPPLIAQGIREILLYLRLHLPAAHLLLLGILPRSESPMSERRRQVTEVNQLIRSCADRLHVFYADVGDALLDAAGRLPRDVSPDGVHLSERGYVLLSDRLEQEFGTLPLGR
jgi:beta-glucosidase